MGMFDSFSAEVICNKCKNVFYDDNIQSKDFECMLDHLLQGERTDKIVSRYFLEDSSMTRNGKEGYERWLKNIADKDSLVYGHEAGKLEDHLPLTREQVLEKYGDETKFSIYWSPEYDDSWTAYKKTGESKTVFDGIHERDFNCYTSCPKCKEHLEMTGHIVNDVFVGVDVNG